MSDERFFNWASWTSLNTGLVSLQQDWTERRLPKIFWSHERLPLRKLESAPRILYGDVSGYFCERNRVYFVVRGERFCGTDCDTDGVYVAGSFNGWEQAIGHKEWKLEPRTFDDRIFFTLSRPETEFQTPEPIRFKFVTGKGRWLPVPDDAPNVETDTYGNRNYVLRPQRTGRHLFRFTTPQPLSLTDDRHLLSDERQPGESVAIQPGVFLKQLQTRLPLGVFVENGKTTFRLFAPQASSVGLYLFEDLPQDRPTPIYLTLREGMVWETTVEGKHHGWFYYYRVSGESMDTFSHFDPNFRVLDPYALAAVGPLGPGIVIDAKTLPRPKKRFTPPAIQDLVVLEAHVRDLTAHAPLELSPEERRGFTGLKKWVEHPAFYPAELGVNAVELQPIQLFDAQTPEEYHWGYMPVSYFSPATQYALNPEEASQIQEFADLVEAFHRRGLAVILDVVYNHIGEPNFLQFIDKQYYFLLSPEGDYMNFSGTGNTLDCNTPMVRRLIIDSLTHLVETFDVDGFRFDLGELLGRDTLDEVARALQEVKPGLIFVAEPWSFRGHIVRDLMDTPVASWNDGYREYLARYVRNEVNPDGLAYFMRGSPEIARFPAQTVNYVESHDDVCWIDKITENPGHNGDYPTPLDRRRTHLMTAILMMTAGLPMLNSGMDFLKSKFGVHNTYQRGDLNALPYERQVYYSGTHAYVRNWIQFRLSEQGALLRLKTHAPDSYYHFITHHHAAAVLLNADGSSGAQKLLFAVNPMPERVEFDLSELDLAEMLQIADHERLDEAGLPSARLPSDSGALALPGHSCGLWVIG